MFNGLEAMVNFLFGELIHDILQFLMSSDNLIQPSSVSSLRIRSAGAVDTESYRVYLEHESDRLVSPFHDVPLYADSNDVTLVHMICEIPKWSNAKLEVPYL